jgi:hypothetical protein
VIAVLAWSGFGICLLGIVMGQIRSWQWFIHAKSPSDNEVFATALLWTLGTGWEIWSCFHLLRFR